MTSDRPFMLSGSWIETFNQLPQLSDAFTAGSKEVKCIDERTPDSNIHIAGGGILLPIEEQIALLAKARATAITRHEGCGAEKAWAEREGLTGTEAEAALQARYTQVGATLGIPVEKIPGSAMVEFGPLNRHETGVIYYDGTGRFDYSKVAQLPRGFIISRSLYEDSANPLFEANFAISIALGGHGLTTDWLKKNHAMITLVAVGSKELPVELLKAELAPLVDRDPSLIKLDGFDATPFLS